jgi:hypothetical protein
MGKRRRTFVGTPNRQLRRRFARWRYLPEASRPSALQLYDVRPARMDRYGRGRWINDLVSDVYCMSRIYWSEIGLIRGQ